MVLHNNIEHLTKEEKRLKQDEAKHKYWKRWGPYLSERQWATVREDYSNNGDAWTAFPFEHARSRTYRWGEDGIAGVSDNHQFECISFAFWNEKDDILKERLFGLAGPLGNHGEDVKELYFYLDNTPTHSYMKYLYKYPQKKFPYEELQKVNGELGRLKPEFELSDTGIFAENRYFDIFVEMAKDGENEEELLFRITAYNRGPEPAPLHIVPQLFFRNTWSWGLPSEEGHAVPEVRAFKDNIVETEHWKLGKRYFQLASGCSSKSGDVTATQMFTDNITNKERLYETQSEGKYKKDAFHDFIIEEDEDAVNPEKKGTKFGAWYNFGDDNEIDPGDFVTIRVKYTNVEPTEDLDEKRFDKILDQRQDEADDFYYNVCPMPISDDLRNVQRQALAGMLWTKQFYYFIHSQWSKGDPNAEIAPMPDRANGRNRNWKHLHIEDILSLPDKWEYPFFAVWDTAFHCIPLAMIDPAFAKKQLDLMTREWYMHPNGQIPAYEWNFGDVNPPVHAWATFRTFKIERKLYGTEDWDFLERVFQKLLLNFTWWVNRKDGDGNNVFEGGFLGLDNIGLFNRSEPLPTGGVLEQADSTGWMAFFSLQMMNIALELAKKRRVYEDIASKFFEHFVFIADAMSFRDGGGVEKALWNDEDGFYYDAISWGGPWSQQLPVRSLVGLIPMYASLTVDPAVFNQFKSFGKRVAWFIENRPEMAGRNIASMSEKGKGDRLLFALVNKERLTAILERMLDEEEFLSEYGIRSLSKFHEKHPYSMDVNGEKFEVDYVPGDSNTGMFGGNSNWRGPIWFPTNFLLIESLQRLFMYYGETFKVEHPKGSGNYLNLAKVAENLQHRLINLFKVDDEGRRPYNGGNDILDFDENFKDYLQFPEFFHADSGRGLGAMHQCGWTALVGKLIYDVGVTLDGNTKTPANPEQAAERFFDDVTETKTRNHHRRKSQTMRLQRRMSSRSIGDTQDSEEPEIPSNDQEAHNIAEHIRARLERLVTEGDTGDDEI